MRPDEVLKKIKKLGGEVEVLRTRGSHRHLLVTKDGKSARTVLATHKREVATGTLNSIVEDLEPVLGKDWNR